jgi:hypothetical protein
MTKILQMTRSLGRAVSETVHEASDPLEPTQPLSPRDGYTPHPFPFPMVRPWYPAALVLGARSHDFPPAA